MTLSGASHPPPPCQGPYLEKRKEEESWRKDPQSQSSTHHRRCIPQDRPSHQDPKSPVSKENQQQRSFRRSRGHSRFLEKEKKKRDGSEDDHLLKKDVMSRQTRRRNHSVASSRSRSHSRSHSRSKSHSRSRSQSRQSRKRKKHSDKRRNRRNRRRYSSSSEDSFSSRSPSRGSKRYRNSRRIRRTYDRTSDEDESCSSDSSHENHKQNRRHKRKRSKKHKRYRSHERRHSRRKYSRKRKSKRDKKRDRKSRRKESERRYGVVSEDDEEDTTTKIVQSDTNGYTSLGHESRRFKIKNEPSRRRDDVTREPQASSSQKKREIVQPQYSIHRDEPSNQSSSKAHQSRSRSYSKYSPPLSDPHS